jgi:four helix bundle protein
MPRDHRKLNAFELADDMAVAVYGATKAWPVSERFGLQTQIRRAAVSVATNIVEGCAREGEKEFLRFLDIAFGSCREVLYLASLSVRLGFLDLESATQIEKLGNRTAGALLRLRQAVRRG